MDRRVFFGVVACVAAVLVASAVLWPKDQTAVTVYCAADQDHAEPILQRFEAETGIKVHAQYDTEASKTIGLVQRLREEKGAPQCDVFWNNEPLHSMLLAEEGLFDPYTSPSAATIPPEFKDPKGRWTGFAARGRILIGNTNRLAGSAAPRGMADLADPARRGTVALARPRAGTTLTHAVVLYSVLGPEKASAWFRAIRDNQCSFPTGNGPLARSVAEGVVAFGFTDTDDFRKFEREGAPVERIIPDQEEGGTGTLLLPNTVGLVRGAPHSELAKRLIDFLLTEGVEEQLAKSDGAHIPLRGSVPRPAHVKGPPEIRAMKVDWADVVRRHRDSVSSLREILGD